MAVTLFSALWGTACSGFAPDGAGEPQRLTRNKNQQTPYSVTPDGKRLAYHEQSTGTGLDLWTLPIESDGTGLKAGKPEVFLQTQFSDRSPVFSPDGRWLAYSSDESGTYQVYVRSFPDNGGKWQISNNGGVYREFSRDGRELFFRTEDSRMIMAASHAVKGDSFDAGKPRVWSETRIGNTGLNGFNYDLAPDGKRRPAATQSAGGEVASNSYEAKPRIENGTFRVRRHSGTIRFLLGSHRSSARIDKRCHHGAALFR